MSCFGAQPLRLPSGAFSPAARPVAFSAQAARPGRRQQCAARARRRIGIFGLFGSGNLGNDGSLESFLDFLRSAYPDAELHVHLQRNGQRSGAVRPSHVADPGTAAPEPAG